MKSKTMISNAGSSGKRAGERGGASVIVIFLMLFATAVATSSVVNRYRETRSREASQTRLRENWEAKSAVAVLDRVIKNRLPAQNLRDLEFAVNDCDADPGLAAFDAQNVPLENSRPVATVGGTPSCTESVSNTSLLGNINSYLLIRQAYLQSEVAAFGYSQDQVRITTLEESVRRFTTGLPPVFQIHYVLDARGGRFGAVRFEGDVVLGTASQSCGTTAVISANRAQIQSGENVTLTISYSMAKNLKIYEANGGTLIHEVNVSESAAPQNYTYTFKPTATNSYRVKATGATADCTSESTAVPVVVSAPSICASNPPKINAYGASSMLVNAGEEIFLVWQTSGSISTVTLNGASVPANHNNHRVSIYADTVFTLLVNDNDPAANCAAQQQLIVRVRNNPCTAPTPSVTFSANQTSIQTGQSVNLAWSAAVEPGGEVIFTEADGATRSIPASGTDTRVFNAPGTYVYKVTAKNNCPNGIPVVQEKTVTITVGGSCAIPVINSFAANPGTVVAGGNQTVRLAWNVSGTVNSLSISGIGNVSGSFIDIVQPQTTTAYTLSATGCGNTQTRSANVTVTTAPPGGNSCSSRTDTAYYCDANTNTRFIKSLQAEIQATGGDGYRVIVPEPQFAGSYTALFNTGSYRVTTSSMVTTVTWSNGVGCAPSANNYCYDANGLAIGGRALPTAFTVTSANGVNVFGSYNLYRGDGCDFAGDRLVNATFEADTNNCTPEIIVGSNYSPFNSPGILEMALCRTRKACGFAVLGFIH